MRYLVLAFLLLGPLSPCRSQTGENPLVWPPAPDKPRIQHLRTISSAQDLGVEKGFFKKLLGFVFGSEDSSPWFVQPVGIAVDDEGRILVADPGAGGVHLLHLEKKQHRFQGQTRVGPFLSPVGVAFGPRNQIFVSDSRRGEVLVCDGDLDVRFVIRDSLVRPTGIAVRNGRVFVADAGRHSIIVFDLKGVFQGAWGVRGAEAGEFNYPVALAAHEELYVVDAMNHRLQIFTGEGKMLRSVGHLGTSPGSFSSPKTVAMDSDSNIYVTDALFDNFQIFNRRGELLLVVGRQGQREGEFLSPNGIAIDRSDRIHVVDMLNRRLQIFQYLK